MIALDIADHFKTKVRPNGFKAQVVAPSRLAAMRYARHLNDFHVRAYPIITTTPNDGVEFKEAMELNQDQVTNDFKNPDGEPEVLVVVDMLLTGFDAPVEQVLYLDRGLQEHGLLQSRGPGQPALQPRARRRVHREGLRPGGGLLRRVPQPGGCPPDLRPARRDGRDAGTGRGPDDGAGGGGGRGGSPLQGSRPG